ncbi:MAG TPA: hypothetical protein VLS93_09715, partial [Anaeromyxobacteraceae bacterium]|nr:hypothetical protein [Anaeromyxobacteraceae bacterium]
MERWEKILGLVRSPWAVFALAVVALLAVVWRLNAARGELQAARDAASLAAAEAELRAAGELVAEREEAEGLRRRLAETSAELRAAVARA